jgi:hypothetical protein
MSINQISGPSGSQWTSPTPPTQTDITTAANNWQTQQTAMTQALTTYNAAKTTLDNQVSDMLNEVPSATQADMTALTQAMNNFTAAKTALDQATTAADTAALLLINTEAAYQESVDEDTDSQLNSYINQLQGTIDTTLYNEIVASNTNRETQRSLLDTAINNYRTIEDSVENDREALTNAQYQESLDGANAIIADGLSDQTSWESDVNTAQAPDATQVTNDQATLSQDIATRTSAETTLTNAITAFQNAFNDPTTGLTTLLTQALTAEEPTLQAHINQINSDITTVANYTANLLSAAQAADATTLEAYEASTPLQSQTLQNTINDTSEASASASATAVSTTLTSQFLQSIGLNISLPQVPDTGQTISMLDLMSFITSTQLVLNDVLQNASLTDNLMNQLRMQVWQYLLSAVAQEYGSRLAYLMEISLADSNYDTTVTQENDDEYQAAVTSTDAINSQLTNINAVIDQVNTQNASQQANYTDIINGLNTSAQNSVNLINQANDVQPDAVNTLNLYGLDPTAIVPTPAPIPSAQSSLTIPTIPQISAIPAPPDPDSNPPPTQADIDTYNAAIEAVNASLYPITDALAAANPPIIFTPLIPIYYAQSIDIRNFSSEFDFTALSNSVSALVSIVHQAFLQQGATSDFTSEITAAQLKVKQALIQELTATPQSQNTTGTGVGFAVAGATKAPGIVGKITNECLQSQTFKDTTQNLLEQGAFIGALPAALRMPPGVKNYSVLGMRRKEIVSTIDEGVDEKTANINDQNTLQSVADQLLNQAGNVTNLRNNALATLAENSSSTDLTGAQANQVLDNLVVSQQTLLTSAAAIAASAGPGISPTDANRNLNVLFGQPTLNSLAQDLTAQGITVSASLTPGTPAYYQELFNQAENITPSAQQGNLRQSVIIAAAKLGISPSAISSGVPLGSALATAMTGAPSAFVAGLGINLGALPPDVLQKAQDTVSSTLGGITFLSTNEKLQLAVAIGGGIIPQAYVPSLAADLANIQTNGPTAANLAKLDELNPREIPKQLQEKFRALAQSSTQNIESMTRAFMVEQDPAKFAVDFLLDPAHLMAKQFSARTATPVKGSPPQTSQMQV